MLGSSRNDTNFFFQLIERFQKGEFNVLVATSIGEEGLDIGEIDLTVCYDTDKAPTRMVATYSCLILFFADPYHRSNDLVVQVVNERVKFTSYWPRRARSSI